MSHQGTPWSGAAFLALRQAGTQHPVAVGRRRRARGASMVCCALRQDNVSHLLTLQQAAVETSDQTGLDGIL